MEIINSKNLSQQFGIRAFLKAHPDLVDILINKQLKLIINQISKGAQIIKSIYFDKPPHANWLVNWHQDLTINVEGKTDTIGFKNWRILKDRTIVQAPLSMLENIFTIRVHLDDCTIQNGALRVIPGSHKSGVFDIRHGIGELSMQEEVCQVKKGGVLVMKPLLLHASRRIENNQNRRVIHIEFSNMSLPQGLEWQESITIG